MSQPPLHLYHLPLCIAAHGRVSIDTRKAEVARAAVAAGATLLNDITAELWPVAAELGVGWVAMHMRGEPGTMQREPRYDDVVAEVCAFLEERAALALGAGVREVWVDPGIGFGKTAEHNLDLLAHLDHVTLPAGALTKETLVRTFATSLYEGRVHHAAPNGGGEAPSIHPLAAELTLAAALLTELFFAVQLGESAALGRWWSKDMAVLQRHGPRPVRLADIEARVVEPLGAAVARLIAAMQGAAGHALFVTEDDPDADTAAVQAAIAAEPRPIHVPRERPPVVVLDEGPLVLVETRRDLAAMTLPFEKPAA